MDAKLRQNLPRVLGVAIALIALMALGAPQAFASEVVIPPGDGQPPVEPPPPDPPPPEPPAPQPPPPPPVPPAPADDCSACMIIVKPPPARKRPKKVCSKREYVRDRPRGVPIATLQRNDRVKLGRRAKSGRWSYVITRSSRGWIRTSALCR